MAHATRSPDWYLRERRALALLFWRAAPSPGWLTRRLRAQRERIVAGFAVALRAGRVILGELGPAFDRERVPIDRVVIHHTSRAEPISRDVADALGLLRLYAKEFADPAREYAGAPLWSGHVDAGRQVFYPYHWLIRPDGTVTPLLDAAAIGWHAGDWSLNCRSVGICLDGDFDHSSPTPAQLDALRGLLRSRYAGCMIQPHRASNPGTSCPGRGFPTGWFTTALSRAPADRERASRF